MYKHILIAVDGSDTSRAALADGLKLAREQGAKVLLLHVYEPFVSSSTHGLVDLTQAIREEGEKIAAAALAEHLNIPTIDVDPDHNVNVYKHSISQMLKSNYLRKPTDMAKIWNVHRNRMFSYFV